jgi:hypothetical protein
MSEDRSNRAERAILAGVSGLATRKVSWRRLEQKTYRLLGQTRRRVDVNDIAEGEATVDALE